MSCEINKIHSKGNTFPGHTELTSLGDIEDKEFSGEIKIALLSEEGKPVSDENGYVIRPLTVDLARKKLPEIASEIEQHFTFGDNQVKIASYLDDVKLIPASEMGENFTFNLEVENSEHNSDIYMQAVSIAYGNGLLLFSQDLSEKINAKPYQTIGTKTPITVNLKNLPSIAKDFTIKINVSGSYAEIDYDLSLSEIKDYYSASSVKGNDSSIIKPKAESYISSKFDEGVFSITGKQGIKFGIEELNSNFFQEIRCNNIFTEQKEIKGSALNFKVVEKLKNRPELLNTSLLMPNKYNLPSTSIGGNSALKELLEVQNKLINFRHSNSIFYKFTTEIIEKVSYDAHKVDILNDYERSFQEALDDKQNRISGVNVEEEIAKSMILRNIHEATTSLVKTIDGMFSELLDAI